METENYQPPKLKEEKKQKEKLGLPTALDVTEVANPQKVSSKFLKTFAKMYKST